MADIEMLPLPRDLRTYLRERYHSDIQDYARDVAEHNIKAMQEEVVTLEQRLVDVMGEVDWLDRRADQLQAELDNRWATGVHTCHDKCQRVACVLRRDNKRLAEALRECIELIDTLSPLEGDTVRKARAALRDHDQEGTNDR